MNYLQGKLVFRVIQANVGQNVICEVQSSHVFCGHHFVFKDPESFELLAYEVGMLPQLRGVPIPCVVLQGGALILDTSSRSTSHKIQVRLTGPKPLLFACDLYGTFLLGEGEEFVEQPWQVKTSW